MKKVTITSFSMLGGRENNEDSCAFRSENRRTVALVADGLGGMADGEKASALVTEKGCEWLMETKDLSRASITQIVSRLNAAILALQLESGSDMMTTLTGAVIEGRHFVLFHVGDSRYLRLRKGRILCRSKDHSAVQGMVELGELKREDIPQHPSRNLLLRVLGQLEQPVPEIHMGHLFGKDRILLSTDGFWEKLSEKELAGRLQDGDSHQMMDELKLLALERADEGSDNMTALLITLEK